MYTHLKHLKNTGLAGIFFATLILSGCDKNASQEAQKNHEAPEKTVAWLTLGEQNQGNTRLLSGTVSSSEATRLSFESQGKIKSIKVKLGDVFKQGDVLATLDDTNYRLQLQRANTQLNSAIENRNHAQRELNRLNRLGSAIAQSKIDGLTHQLELAKQAIRAAHAQLSLAKKQLNDTQLKAPYNGVIATKFAEVGQLAGPSVPIFGVETQSSPEVTLSVPENIISQIKLNQSVQVRIPALDSQSNIAGIVSQVSSRAQFGAFAVKIKLNTQNKDIRSGMTAEVITFSTHQANGFTLPPSALGAGQGNAHFVYKINASNTHSLTLERVPVEVISLSKQSIIISSGNLQAGDKIVRSGWGFLSPKQRVKLMGVGPETINP